MTVKKHNTLKVKCEIYANEHIKMRAISKIKKYIEEQKKTSNDVIIYGMKIEWNNIYVHTTSKEILWKSISATYSGNLYDSIQYIIRFIRKKS